jgi:RNA polymerase sigma-70 factor (ECF subfamily)
LTHLFTGRIEKRVAKLGRAQTKNEIFSALLLPLQRSLETYCRRMLRNPSDVEDVLQNGVTEAFARFDRYVEGTNFRAWIFRFVTFALFNHNRKREPKSLGAFLDEVQTGPQAELTETAVSTLVETPDLVMEHFDDQVADALWRLSKLERTVLLLRALGEFSYQEIHEILSIPIGSVMGYLSRARQNMRRCLAAFAQQRGLVRRTEEQSP